ncbi:MAG: tRNA (adenosine(37)-N6)-threonylcarbamoyltransferase complex ATPase subunit type 1 TsaE [Candidatus Colwellbacteria bacterium]
MNKHTSKSEKETKEIALEFVKEAMSKGPKKGSLVLALKGDLGAGKTTFTQALGKALGVKKRILSPTFLVMKRFPLPPKSKFKNLYHIDAYRVGPRDLRALGVGEILKEANVVIIEWADKVKSILPKETFWIRFEHGKDQNERKITIN